MENLGLRWRPKMRMKVLWERRDKLELKLKLKSEVLAEKNTKRETFVVYYIF